MSISIEIIQADLSNPLHGRDLLLLLQQYAIDITGGGQDLQEHVKQNLVAELRKRSGSVVILAYEREAPAGLMIAFEGFSTFYAKPLMNIHDFVVSEKYRGKGIARQMLQKIEAIAAARGCCKLTLEVLEGNVRAQKVYKAYGFAGYELDDTMGKAMFLEKKL